MKKLTSNLIQRMSFLLLLSIVFLCLTLSVEAQLTRYVSTSGNDNEGANTCTSLDSKCRTIGQAIYVASPGDTIRISDGVYTEVLVIEKSLYISGAGRGITIIQSQTEPESSVNTVVTVSDNYKVQIDGVTIRYGFQGGGGGGIHNRGGDLTLTGVTISENEAPISYGGGILNLGGSCTLDDVIFQDNWAAYDGGGLFNSKTKFSMNNVTFINNSTLGLGGAVINLQSEGTFNHVLFDGNEAGQEGGAIYNQESSTVLTDVIFQNNSSESDGGGIYNIKNSSGELSGVRFTANHANGMGGAIFNEQSSPEITDAEFAENSAKHGGAVFNAGSSPNFANVVFTHNLSDSTGGAMVNTEGSSSRVVNTGFTGNTAYQGGALFNLLSAPLIYNSTFRGNAAGDRGGALYNEESDVQVLNTIIRDNNATTGNQIWNGPGSSATIRYSIYGDDTGDLEGDGITLENSASTDPFEGNADSSELHIIEGSPAIDAGDPVSDTLIFPLGDQSVLLDADGNPRIVNGRIDIGMYEYINTTGYNPAPDAPSLQIYPNPFRTSTMIRYRTSVPGRVTVRIYDGTGREVSALVDMLKPAGIHDVPFNATGLPQGIYLCRITCGNRPPVTARLCLIR